MRIDAARRVDLRAACPDPAGQRVAACHARRLGQQKGDGAVSDRDGSDSSGAGHATDTARDPRWQRVVARDRAADGSFWYSVRTTGVYCRPSCPSRVARPENVALHQTLADARATGARPCLRCRPDDATPQAARTALIAGVCRMIEAAERPPSLAMLSREVGLSPAHFQRVFKAATGVSPKAYAEAHRTARVQAALRERGTVTEALYTAGFASSGRFYDRSGAMLGMTPGRFRAGACAESLHFAIGHCTLGAILVASSAKGVAAILLGEQPEALVRELQDQFPHAELIGADSDYETHVAHIVGFVDAPNIGLDLPLDIRGTAFQRRVWAALQTIPPGARWSYADVARAIGAPRAVRAVAGACAANVLAVAIPCHRVVRTDGALSGYRWGVERKCALLDREAGT